MCVTFGDLTGKGLALKWRLFGALIAWGSLGVVSAFSYGVTDDGMQWVSDDVVGSVYILHIQESTLYRKGGEWVEDEPNHHWILTFDRAKTYTETLHVKPIVPGLDPRSSMCLIRDQNNRIVQSFHCDIEKRPIDNFKNLYLYDAQGRLVEDRVERLEGKRTPDVRNVYDYDSTGEKVAWRVYGSDGSLSTITTFSRDRARNLVTVQVQTATGEFKAKEIHRVDSLGRTIEVESFNLQGETVSKTHSSFNDHGKRVERIFSGRGGGVRELDSYEYDERGNWIKRTRQVFRPSGEERFVTNRVIEYYPE